MKKVLIAAILLIVTHFAAVQAIAEMYKWVDQDGVTHFSDEPPVSEQKVEIIETSKYQEPPPKKISKKYEESKKKDEVKTQDKVEIYTTSWCRYCKEAIAFLRENQVDYIQYDIEKDPKAAEKMMSSGGSGGVPFAIINKRKVYGFSIESYKKALGLK